MCRHCPLRRTCFEICPWVEAVLPSMQTGRVDHADLERLYQGRIVTHAMLDNVDVLTPRQQDIVQLYFRENLQQTEIAERLGISQQAIADALVRAKVTVGQKLKGHLTLF
jgi:RNA polymerase sigma factor (sigma-70 family)